MGAAAGEDLDDLPVIVGDERELLLARVLSRLGR